MNQHPFQPVRRPRADAIKNRDRVLEAAKIVFSAGGATASLEAVARQAGVGIGTLYRHFPTREALFEAVYRREVEQLSDLADQLNGGSAPVDALRQWLHAMVGFIATKQGMVAALALTVSVSSDLTTSSMARLTAALAVLMDRAVASGDIRADITPQDLLRALIGMCYFHDRSNWQASVLKLVDVLIEGLKGKI